MKLIGFCGEQVRYVEVVDGSGRTVREIDYRHETMRDIAITNYSIKVVDRHDPPGYSQRYQWGPEKGSFIQTMSDEDWETLRASPNGINFIDVTDDPREERWMKPTESFLADTSE